MDLVQRSVEIVRGGQHAGRAYVASPEFPTYRYAWVRDGSFVALAMDAVGHHDSAHAFHRWVARVVLRHRHRVEAIPDPPPRTVEDRMVLHARYTLEGEEGEEPWPNFQLDSYGFWLSSLAHHLAATGRGRGEFRRAVEVVVRFLSLLWDRPCADCWEEHPDRRHPTSLAAVAAGLRAAGRALGLPAAEALGARVLAHVLERGTVGGALAKFEGSEAVDGSALLVLGPMGPFQPDGPVAQPTLDRVERELVGDGGLRRYAWDEYYGGGLWVPLAGALAWVRALRGEARRAREHLRWVEGTAREDGALPEQVATHLLRPDRLRAWEERWGPVACPLLWSHAMYLLAARSLGTD
ncbi:MAG TPA: glycoside hydrolase family 15 protein [Actinomycetota bacterium]|nr:glycoside hydrolase family 15 protein [Actinomycetota bacterium]